jgi:hypothetical protein
MVRIVSAALLLVGMLAGSASAECAWVLWSVGRDPTKGGISEGAKPIEGK